MNEIVGALIDGIITNSLPAIIAAGLSGKPVRLLSRLEMKFMAMADLGPRWQAMAKSPVLFVINEAGEFLPPNTHCSRR